MTHSLIIKKLFRNNTLWETKACVDFAYSDQFDDNYLKDVEKLKQFLIDSVTPGFFPDELVSNTNMLEGHKKVNKHKLTIKKYADSEQTANEDEDSSDKEIDSQTNYGDEDYIIHHELEEDKEDDFLDKNEVLNDQDN